MKPFDDEVATYNWPDGVKVRAHTRAGGGAYAVADFPDKTAIGVEAAPDAVIKALWDACQLATAPDHTHQFDREGRYDGWGTCAVCTMVSPHAFEKLRTIDTNGAGFCKHCNMFASDVFDIAEVGEPCAVCGVGTNWATSGDKWYCEPHAPSRQELRAARRAARTGDEGWSLDALFDALAPDDDDDDEEL